MVTSRRCDVGSLVDFSLLTKRRDVGFLRRGDVDEYTIEQ